ncbi:MAG: hypothetical protein ABEJ99_02775 [Candidatus Nanohaloarchaea archaeon]
MPTDLADRAGRALSVAFHPMIAPWFLGAFVLYLADIELYQALKWLLIFGGIAIVPITLYIYFDPDYTLFERNPRELRNRLYIIGIGEILFMGLLMFFLSPPHILFVSYVACLLSVLAGGVINKFYTKISIHVGLVSAFATAIAYLVYPAGVLALLMPIAVAWARLHEKKHDLFQVTLGFFVPAAIITVCYLFML